MFFLLGENFFLARRCRETLRRKFAGKAVKAASDIHKIIKKVRFNGQKTD